MRRDVVNALTRSRRQARFVVADRYRALLDGRHPSLAAAAASAVDTGTSLVAAARGLRGRPTEAEAVSLLAATMVGDDSRRELSIVVRGAAEGAVLHVRRGERTMPLPTVVAPASSLLRLLAEIPDEIVDAKSWTVLVGDPSSQSVVATAGRRLRPPLGADARGHLTLSIAPATGLAHTIEVGVRTAVVTWPADAGETLVFQPTDNSTPPALAATVANGTATALVDLAVLAVLADRDVEWTPLVNGTPLARPFPRTDARVAVVGLGAGRRVEVGYDSGNRLVVRTGGPGTGR